MINLKYIRLYSNYEKGEESFEKNILLELEDIVKLDRGCFILLNHFFYINTDNHATIEDAKKSLYIEKEFVELENKLNDTVAVSLIDKLLDLYSISINDYRKIRSKYIELIVLRWKALPGRYSKVYNEPKIYIKRKKAFKKADYANSLCDIVHVDFKKRVFEMYECKVTMKAFANDLIEDHRRIFNNRKKKNVLRSKRKQNYLSAYYDFIKNNTDVIKSDFAYATLAPKDELLFDQIGNIRIIGNEELTSTFDEIWLV